MTNEQNETITRTFDKWITWQKVKRMTRNVRKMLFFEDGHIFDLLFQYFLATIVHYILKRVS